MSCICMVGGTLWSRGFEVFVERLRCMLSRQTAEREGGGRFPMLLPRCAHAQTRFGLVS
eukprot:25138_6